MTKTPSRILNERAGFLGLSIVDVGAIGYFLILSHAILKNVKLELLCFPLTALLSFLLLGVRQKNRPKSIRDYLSFKLNKTIGGGGGGGILSQPQQTYALSLIRGEE